MKSSELMYISVKYSLLQACNFRYQLLIKHVCDNRSVMLVCD